MTDSAVTAPAQPPGFGMGGGMGGAFPGAMSTLNAKTQAIADATRAMVGDAGEAPGRLGRAVSLLTDAGEVGSIGSVLAGAAGWLVAALLVAVLVHRVLRPVRARLRHAAGDSPGRTAAHIIEALLVDLAPPAAYALVGLALLRLLFGREGMVFHGTDTFHMVLSAFIINSTIAWLAAEIVLAIPLAVERPGLRLLPLDDREAYEVRRFLRQIVVIGTASWIVAESLYLVWLGDGVPRLILIAASMLIGILCLRALGRVKPSSHFEQSWHKLAIASVFGLVVTWVLGLLLDASPPFGRVLGTLAILAALPFADGMVRLLLNRVKRRLASVVAPPRTIYIPSVEGDVEALHAVERPLAGAALASAEAETDRSLDAFAGVLHDAADTALSIAAGVLLARTWSLDIAGLLGHGQVRSLLGEIVDAGATLLVAWYIWRLFETGLAVRLSRDEGGSESRARTVQPLLRAVGKLVIGAVALMGALSALGLNIAPLLASAGVVGIAVGFGAQTLVKDLFSGACYLIEDVFRIGDYIEAGTAKGTVEKITFRTIALRHQNGPLHYVPYGSLGSVRNNSRDWVIDKFEIPLPTDVPSERIRKLVKKIGEEMTADPRLAPDIMMPLKAKLYRIQPGAKIFRCKVQTPPGRQFEIRSEAYRRIETALAEAGIAFAALAPQVTINNAGPHGETPLPARAAE